MAYVKNLFDQNFIQYASYVIRDRAIPEITDGLKPVQSRIIHTLIKTDDDFVRLIHFYQKFYTRCDKFVDITNAERQECKETVKQRIQDAVTKNEPCEKVMSENYTAVLSEYCDLFKYKQNYMKELKEDMDKYGKENFCSTANWETEIKKLNCKK